MARPKYEKKEGNPNILALSMSIYSSFAGKKFHSFRDDELPRHPNAYEAAMAMAEILDSLGIFPENINAIKKDRKLYKPIWERELLIRSRAVRLEISEGNASAIVTIGKGHNFIEFTSMKFGNGPRVEDVSSANFSRIGSNRGTAYVEAKRFSIASARQMLGRANAR